MSQKASVDFSHKHHRAGQARGCRSSNPRLPISANGAKLTPGHRSRPGYSIVTVKIPQGNLTGDQMRGLADLSEQAGDGSLRFTMNQNVVLAYVPVGALKRVYGALKELGLHESGADEISDVITCPGAYSCNLALTKTMGLGAAIVEVVRNDSDPQVRRLRINASGCPNSCGQHWIGDIGFYGNARKIDGREVPYYLMLLGGTQQQFGVAIQSLPARLAPAAVERVLEHFKENRHAGRILPRVRAAPQSRNLSAIDGGSGQTAPSSIRKCTRTGATRSIIRWNSAAASARRRLEKGARPTSRCGRGS